MSENTWYYMGRPFDELSDNEVAAMLWQAHSDYKDDVMSPFYSRTFWGVLPYATERLGRERVRAIVLDDLRPVTLTVRRPWYARLWAWLAAWRKR